MIDRLSNTVVIQLSKLYNIYFPCMTYHALKKDVYLRFLTRSNCCFSCNKDNIMMKC